MDNRSDMMLEGSSEEYLSCTQSPARRGGKRNGGAMERHQVAGQGEASSILKGCRMVPERALPKLVGISLMPTTLEQL